MQHKKIDVTSSLPARINILSFVGWILAIIMPFIVHEYLFSLKISWSVNYFLTFFTGASILWMFQLTPPLLPIIFVLTCYLVIGIVPSRVILSGFTSNSFFLILSLFFLSAIITHSGLSQRITYIILKYTPNRLFFLEIILLLNGFLLSTFITSQTNRIDLTVPFYRHILHESFFENKKALQALSLAMYVGAIYFSELFLTGKSANIAVYSMMPEQTQLQFTWLNWLIAASVPVTLMLAPYFICYITIFRHNMHFNIDKEDLSTKLKHLGKLSFQETVATISICIIVVGIVLSSLHLVDFAWYSLGVLLFLLLLSVFSKQEFRNYVNWGYLLYLGGILGIVNSFHYLNIDRDVIWHFQFLIQTIQNNTMLFILGVALLCFISSFILGVTASMILLFPLLLPFAAAAEISPWVLGFVILVSGEFWIFPFQSFYFLYFKDLVEDDPSFQLKTILRMNVLFGIFRIVALVLSVYWWRHLKIL